MSTKQTDQAKQLATLLRRLASHYKPEPPPQRDPVAQVVLSFLQYDATREQAEQAFEKIMEHMVDINDLRVSLEDEIIDIIGRDYPFAQQRVARMLQALYAIYNREHAMQMHGAEKAGKKEQRYYLDTLPGMLPYVAAQVMLLCFGGHAMPLDRRLIALLAGQDIISPEISPVQLESWMLRQIKADQGTKTHLLLQAWADDNPVDLTAIEHSQPVPPKRPAAIKKKKVARKKTAKKTSKKAAVTKKSSKKTAASKKTSKKSSPKR